MNSSDLEILRTWITESNNIVFFGGAGILRIMKEKLFRNIKLKENIS